MLYAGGHCHAPSCIREELWDADTNTLLCNVTAEYGDARYGSLNAPFNERGYVAIPPCLWGSADDDGAREIREAKRRGKADAAQAVVDAGMARTVQEAIAAMDAEDEKDQAECRHRQLDSGLLVEFEALTEGLGESAPWRHRPEQGEDHGHVHRMLPRSRVRGDQAADDDRNPGEGRDQRGDAPGIGFREDEVGHEPEPDEKRAEEDDDSMHGGVRWGMVLDRKGSHHIRAEPTHTTGSRRDGWIPSSDDRSRL